MYLEYHTIYLNTIPTFPFVLLPLPCPAARGGEVAVGESDPPTSRRDLFEVVVGGGRWWPRGGEMVVGERKPTNESS